MRRLSATSLKTYLRCPQQWKLKYVDRLPEEKKPYLNLGKAVHAGLEAVYDGRVAAPAPLEEALEAFGEAFDPDAYGSPEEAARRRADGRAMVEDFHAARADGFEPALAVEKRLTFEVEGVAFVGYVDRIDKADDGRLRIVDYKTGGSFDLDRVRTDRQLTLYQVGCEEKLGREVESVTLYHVPSQTPFTAERHPGERIESLRSDVREAAEGIEEDDFEPDPGRHCDWCDFKPHCPAFADRYPENWPQEPSPPAPSHGEAARLADRLGDARARRKELKGEISSIEEELERFFEETGERAVRGDRWRVKARRRKGWRIDDDEALRDVLEPADLWDRVLTPSWRAKAELPDDTDLPGEVRDAVRALARKRVSWRLHASEVEAGRGEAGDDGTGP